MSTQAARERLELLQGTLDLLICALSFLGRSTARGSRGPSTRQRKKSLLAEHGTLNPALQRLEEREWISGDRVRTGAEGGQKS